LLQLAAGRARCRGLCNAAFGHRQRANQHPDCGRLLRTRNHKLNAVVLGQDFGQQVQAMFDKDLARSTPASLVDWRQRGLLARLKEWFASWWEYWL